MGKKYSLGLAASSSFSFPPQIMNTAGFKSLQDHSCGISEGFIGKSWQFKENCYGSICLCSLRPSYTTARKYKVFQDLFNFICRHNLWLIIIASGIQVARESLVYQTEISEVYSWKTKKYPCSHTYTQRFGQNTENRNLFSCKARLDKQSRSLISSLFET